MTRIDPMLYKRAFIEAIGEITKVRKMTEKTYSKISPYPKHRISGQSVFESLADWPLIAPAALAADVPY
jgi:hypothetical protein